MPIAGYMYPHLESGGSNFCVDPGEQLSGDFVAKISLGLLEASVLGSKTSSPRGRKGKLCINFGFEYSATPEPVSLSGGT